MTGEPNASVADRATRLGGDTRWAGQAGDAAAARDQLAALLPVRERVSGPEHPDALAAHASLVYWTGQAERSPGNV
jgi:hypothetical protein